MARRKGKRNEKPASSTKQPSPTAAKPSKSVAVASSSPNAAHQAAAHQAAAPKDAVPKAAPGISRSAKTATAKGLAPITAAAKAPEPKAPEPKAVEPKAVVATAAAPASASCPPGHADTQVARQAAESAPSEDWTQRLDQITALLNQALAAQNAPEQRDEKLRQRNEKQRKREEQLQQREEQLQQRDEQLRQRDEQLRQRDEQLRQRDTELRQHDEQLRDRESTLTQRAADLQSRRREHSRRLRQYRKLGNAGEQLAGHAEGISRLLEAFSGSIERQTEQASAGGREAADQLQALMLEVESQQQLIDTLTADLSEQQKQARELQSQVDQHVCERLFDVGESGNDASQEELADALARVADLERQNHELASKLADNNIREQLSGGRTGGGTSHESMSWEERKQMIMQRLENEDQTMQQSDGVDAPAVLNELQSLRNMVQNTDKEIYRRDAEIAELRQLLEQQSNTVGEVAIGAAAIAGLLDQDDLVREERQKLQQIQTEWQDKLRQAEIEVSLERARLARERQEIEKRNVELEDRILQRSEAQHSAEDLTPEGKPARKWFAKLGLDK